MCRNSKLCPIGLTNSELHAYVVDNLVDQRTGYENYEDVVKRNDDAGGDTPILKCAKWEQEKACEMHI